MRYTLLARSLATFEAYLRSPLRIRFFSFTYLDQLAARVGDTHRSMAKRAAFCLWILALVLFADAFERVSLAAGTVQVNGLHSLRDALIFVLASASFALNNAFLNVYLVEQALHKIYMSQGVFSPRYFYMNIRAEGLWTDMFLLRFFGPKSSWQHRALAYVLLVFMIAVLLLFLLTPAASAIWFAVEIVLAPDKTLLIKGVAIDSIVLALAAIFIPIAALLPINFTEAELDEATGEPTQLLLDKLAQQSETQGGTA